VRPGAGDSGSDRVSLIWPAGTIVDQWLEVSVLSDGPGSIVGATDVHYWGNQRGDTGNSTANTTVNSGDVSNVSANFSGFGSVDSTSIYDLNKDGRVNSGDVSAVTARFSGFAPTLELIAPAGRLQPESAVVSQQTPEIEPVEIKKAIEIATGTDDAAYAEEILDSGEQQADAVDSALDTADSSVEVSVNSPDLPFVDPAPNLDANTQNQVVSDDASFVSSRTSEPTPVLQIVNQPAAVSLDFVDAH